VRDRVYNYMRDYDPATGRYVDSDPIGLAGGVNRYGDVAANPVDPTSLQRSEFPSRGELENLKQRDFARRAFLRNYDDMVRLNWRFSDKYFHCKGNCEAARCGPTVTTRPATLAIGASCTDYSKGTRGRFAGGPSCNQFGRDGAVKNPNQTCSVICSQFRIRGLPAQY
jgi:uncharacterized protein RhaS with RHS repeats